MTTTLDRILLWTPRILTILFILFISLFALDVFAEGYKWYEVLAALFMHLIPSIALLIALIIAWRWPGIGGLLFLVITASFIFFFKLYREWNIALLIAGPPLLVGVLFLADWFSRRNQIATK